MLVFRILFGLFLWLPTCFFNSGQVWRWRSPFFYRQLMERTALQYHAAFLFIVEGSSRSRESLMLLLWLKMYKDPLLPFLLRQFSLSYPRAYLVNESGCVSCFMWEFDHMSKTTCVRVSCICMFPILACTRVCRKKTMQLVNAASKCYRLRKGKFWTRSKMS